jgi:hypothetical protein
MPHGRSPTSTAPTTVFVDVSMITTPLPRPVVTNTCLPSADDTTPIGRTRSPPSSVIVSSGLCACASTTITAAPVSAVM